MPTDTVEGNESHDRATPDEDLRWRKVRERAQAAVRRANRRGRRSYGLLRNRALILAALFVGLLGICAVLYLASRSQSPQSDNKTAQGAGSPANPSPAVQAAGKANVVPTPAASTGDLARSSGAAQNPDTTTEKWPARLARIGLSLALAALLAAILAFRPRKDTVATRSGDIVRTQILIALLTAALMLVASADAVIALTIVGAAVLIRARLPGSDSREGAAILVSGGIGLASGAGRWDVAVILAGFAFAVLWVLESSQPEEATRSVELSVETRNVKQTNEVLREVFDRNRIGAEFLRLDTSDPSGRTGIVHYSITLKQGSSLDRVSEEILAEDPDNILGVNCHHRRWQELGRWPGAGV